MSSDLEDELRQLLADRAERIPAELGERAGHARAARRARRYAPLATAFGVVIAATAAVLVVQFGAQVPNRPVVPPSSIVSSVDIAPTSMLSSVRHQPVLQPQCPTTSGPAQRSSAAATARCADGH